MTFTLTPCNCVGIWPVANSGAPLHVALAPAGASPVPWISIQVFWAASAPPPATLTLVMTTVDAVDAVTVKVAVTAGRLPAAACTVALPVCEPSVTVVEARPVASVTAVGEPTVALVAWNTTVIPARDSAAPVLSRSCTTSGEGKTAPARPVWLLPLATATEAGRVLEIALTWKV